MFRIKGKLQLGNINRIRTFVAQKMNNVWQEAIKEFILAVEERIHVDTGMAKASLQPLAKEVGIYLNIVPKSQPKKGYDDWKVYYPTRYKSPSEGYKLGTKAFLITWGRKDKLYWYFRFNVKVFHYWLHENGFAKYSTGAWRSINAGMLAFEETIKKYRGEMFPSVDKFITKVSITR